MYLAWLQSSTRELQWLEYLKSVFLKIPNVTTWSVFQNQVTNGISQNTGNCKLDGFLLIQSQMTNQLATVWLVIFVGLNFLWILWVLSTKITEF